MRNRIEQILELVSEITFTATDTTSARLGQIPLSWSRKREVSPLEVRDSKSLFTSGCNIINYQDIQAVKPPHEYLQSFSEVPVKKSLEDLLCFQQDIISQGGTCLDC